MKPIIDIKKSKLDSPDYRLEILQTETSIFALENTLKQLAKNMKVQVDLAQGISSLINLTVDYSNKNFALAAELAALSKLEVDEPVIEQALERFSSTITEIEKSRKMMVTDVFLEPLDSSLKRDIQAIKDSKKQFEKMSDGSDSLLEKYLGKRAKDLSIPESAEELSSARREFHETSMKYSSQLNEFQYQKRSDIIENVLALIYTNYTFFHQGYELLKDLEPCMRELTQSLNNVRDIGHQHIEKSSLEQTEMLKLPLEDYSPIPQSADRSALGPNVYTKAGYLVKRGSGKITQVWSRRWFFIKNEYLLYTTRGKDEQPTIAANLRLCTVKPFASDVGDRRFCFEIVSPVKSYVLQAENENELAAWIEVLQNAIGKALNTENTEISLKGIGGSKEKLNKSHLVGGNGSSMLDKESPDYVIEYTREIKGMDGNEYCADCNAENPEWASINLGVLLCIECSGIHRSLGVQVSKVRSMTLDRWELELYEVMLQLGNTKVNSIFEKGYTNASGIKKPEAKSDRAERETWIKAKYVTKRFVSTDGDKMEEKSALNELFWSSCGADDFLQALRNLALGASIDYKKADAQGKPALLFAAENDNVNMVLFLMNLNSDITIADSLGYTCLHYACQNQNDRLVKVLIKRNVTVNSQALDGKSPIDIAIEKADPEIVTALRMYQFEKEQASAPRLSSETSAGSGTKSLPQPPAQQVVGDEENKSKVSPSKLKNFFSPTSPPGRSESPTLASPKAQPSTITNTISSASSYANQAVASASKYWKSNFAKIHSENTPHGPDQNDAGENDADDGGDLHTYSHFNSPYSMVEKEETKS